MITYTVRFEGADGPVYYRGLSDVYAAEVLETTVPYLLHTIQEHGICSTPDGIAVEDGTDVEKAIEKFAKEGS